MNRVTMKDVARVAGVSTSTVSLALRNSPRISPAVRERVALAAQECGYHGDLAGSLLRTTNPRILGLACDLSQELHFAYRQSIKVSAQELGYQVMTEDAGAQGGLINAIKQLRRLRAQALIVIGQDRLSPAVRALLDVPVVSIGQEPLLDDSDVIVSDNTPGMDQVAELLLPCARVLYVDGPASISADHRRRSFLAAAQRHDIAVDLVDGGATIDDGWRAIRATLGGGRRLPAAVVCYNDQCAEGVILALLQAGVPVPEQVRVVGFDNSRIAGSEAFALTTVDRQAPKVARLAVDLAVARAEGLRTPAVRLEVPTRLVRRLTA